MKIKIFVTPFLPTKCLLYKWKKCVKTLGLRCDFYMWIQWNFVVWSYLSWFQLLFFCKKVFFIEKQLHCTWRRFAHLSYFIRSVAFCTSVMADQAALIALLLDQEKANECIEEDRSLVMGQKWQEFSAFHTLN